ncbi:MAG TPA: hypothetical protein VJR89_32185, partial [Polyangiales bacterium]|nr:hypothetical protein [Polyangiales bacterium]
MRRGPAAVVALCALLACGDDEPAAPRVHVQPDASPQPTAAERGKYLVEAVAACGMCHTPRKADGSFDEAKQLSGVECLIDLDPEDAARGCMHSRNLTAHETGLQNRSDDEIADM